MESLAKVRYVLCPTSEYAASNGMPAVLEDIASVPLITSAVGGRELRVSAYRDDERREVSLRPTLASENFQFLRKAVLAGLGVGLVPDYVVKQDLHEGRMVTALPEWRLSIFGTRMFLLRMPGRYQTPAARTLIGFVVGRMRAWAQ